MDEEKKYNPYIITNNYTISLYILVILITLFFTYKVYLYDKKMKIKKIRKIISIHNNKENLSFFKKLSAEDKEFLELYIENIVNRQKAEKTKLSKIINSLKNGFATGFLASILSGSSTQAGILTGLTFGSTNALYKSLINYNSYQKLNLD